MGRKGSTRQIPVLHMRFCLSMREWSHQKTEAEDGPIERMPLLTDEEQDTCPLPTMLQREFPVRENQARSSFAGHGQ